MSKPDRLKAAMIVRDAGGRIVGRTRLQKVAYLLELAGLGEGFRFEYRHYGPYSEQLAEAIRLADVFDLVEEVEKRADWGGIYSIFTAKPEIGEPTPGIRSTFAAEAARADAIALELAATAAYMSDVEKSDDPWGETEYLKPDKTTNGRLEKAKDIYRKLLEFDTPNPLPRIV
jgi:uncharacterized protein YwgA